MLGACFLVHDLGMGLAAYPEGLDSLKSHRLWFGMLRNFIKQSMGTAPTEEQLLNPPTEALRRTQFELLRLLHAERAEKLAYTSWKDGKGDQFYLIDEMDLRQSLGHLIGQISHSHWWPIGDVARYFDRDQGPPVCLPGEWQIDTLRVALLLRLSDAAHIDARRAPAFLRILRHPEPNSDIHWAFQEKLNKVQIDGDRLMYTGSPFAQSEAGAWWLCVDTLRMVDRELRHADSLLSDRGEARFQARSVVAADDLPVLAKLIKPDGWVPVDARIHVGSIATLVGGLGGEELYGKNDLIPLRELIQNSADAIRARRIVKHSASWGTIKIRTGIDRYGPWLEVEDDGIGMSPATMVGSLLDFGGSFWSSNESVIEFPELAATNFRSIGRYGIGFFSVFMWGDRVSVTSRKLDSSSSDTRVLMFTGGVGSRPILRVAELDELLPDGGTRVRVWLRRPKDPDSEWMRLTYPAQRYFGGEATPFQAAVFLCAMLDIHIEFSSRTRHARFGSSVGWGHQKAQTLVKSSYTYGRKSKIPGFVAQHIRTMRNGKDIVGRAAIYPERTEAWLVVGGMRSSSISSFVGVFEAEPSKASREEAVVNLPTKQLAKWANEQAKLIARDFSPEMQADSSMLVAALGGTTDSLFIGKLRGKWSKAEAITRWARKESQIVVLSTSGEYQVKANLGLPNLRSNVMFEPTAEYVSRHFPSAPRIERLEAEAQVELRRKFFRARFDVVFDNRKDHLPILDAIAAAWNCSVEDLFIINMDGCLASSSFSLQRQP